MKTRKGFVSNSSSSSFVIKLKHITARQLIKIQKHREFENVSYNDEWSISIDNKHVYGSTSMDNFEMDEYLEEIGVKSKHINWNY